MIIMSKMRTTIKMQELLKNCEIELCQVKKIVNHNYKQKSENVLHLDGLFQVEEVNS
jgi:hypothetical protein